MFKAFLYWFLEAAVFFIVNWILICNSIWKKIESNWSRIHLMKIIDNQLKQESYIDDVYACTKNKINRRIWTIRLKKIIIALWVKLNFY